MRTTTKLLIGIATLIGGVAMFATFMMVFDELYSIAMYCGPKCTYPFPWTMPLDLWTAWVQTFSWICFSVTLIALGVAQIVMSIMRLRRMEEKY